MRCYDILAWAVIVECLSLNPCCPFGSKLLDSKNCVTCMQTIFSRTMTHHTVHYNVNKTLKSYFGGKWDWEGLNVPGAFYPKEIN